MNLFFRSRLRVALVFAAPMLLGCYVFWLKSDTHANWELDNLRREFRQQQVKFRKLKTTGTATQVAEATKKEEAWLSKTRDRAMRIAMGHPGKLAEPTALLMVASNWPESAEGRSAHKMLLEAATTADIGVWATAMEIFSFPNDDIERWRPLVSQIIRRVEEQPGHPKAARFLCKAARLVRPDQYAETIPAEFLTTAEMIRDKYAATRGIENFCEQVGGMGTVPTWGRSFEPHVRKIIEANHDRLVRCCAKLALASIVVSGGVDRRSEARQLFETFLDEFDGATDYPGQPVEQHNRKIAERMLKRIQLQENGASSFAKAGVDLGGMSMSLKDYRGRVVLVSFWATWCGPCMKAIPHEKLLNEQFDPERFILVGVNGDQDPEVALRAVAEHGISWRSFRNRKDDGSSFESDWQVSAWPTFLLLNAEGALEQRWEGLPPHEELETAIAKLIERSSKR